MQITTENWRKIKAYYNETMKGGMYCTFATVNSNNEPNATPIGSLFLRDDFTGFFFDRFPTVMDNNLDDNGKVCILLVNGSRAFWFRSLVKGVFDKPSGIKLVGAAGQKRESTPKEQMAFAKKTNGLKGFKGYDILWKDMRHVRDITFTDYYQITTGKMTAADF